MIVEIKKVGDVSVSALRGNLVAGSGDKELRQTVAGLLAEDCKAIVVDLRGVSRIDSSGLAELVAAYHAADDAGARIHYVEPGNPARHVLEITQVGRKLDLYESDEAAVAAFK